MCLFNMLGLNNWLQMHLWYWLRKSDDCLKLADCNRDSICLLWDLLLLCLHPVRNVHVLKHMGRFLRQSWEHLHFSIAKVLSKFLHADLTRVACVHSVHMQAKYMAGDSFINSFLSYITNNEDCIKTRQDGWLEVDLLCGMFKVIIATIHRVCCSKYACSGV